MKRVAAIALILFLFTPAITAQKKELRIGTITDNATSSFANEKGAIVGFSIDVTKALMKRMDFGYTIELLDYTTALNKLDNGKTDLLCSLRDSEINPNNYFRSTPYAVLNIDTIARRDEGDCTITSVQNTLQHDNLSNQKIQGSNMEVVKIYFASADSTLIRDIDKQIADLEQSGLLEEIRHNWFGAQKQASPISYIYYGLAAILVIIALGTAFVLILRSKIKQGIKESASKISELQANIKIALNTSKITLWKYNTLDKTFISIEGEIIAGIGMTLEDNLSRLHPDDRENHRVLFEKMVSGELSQSSTTFRIKGTDGIYLTYDSTMNAVKGSSGEILCILGSQRDVTDTHKQMQSAKILSSSLPSMKSFSWYIDMRDGIQHFNCGLKLERDIHQLESSEQFINTVHKDDQQIKERFVAMVKQEKANDVFLFRIDLEKIGEYEWWESHAAVETKYDGTTPYKVICGITINVNEREKKSIEFKRLAQQSQSVLHNSNSILAYINTDYDVQWSNSKVALNGVGAHHYQNNTKCYSTFGYDSPCSNCRLAEAIEQRKLTSFRFDMHKSGRYLTTAIPVISSDDSIDGVVLRVDDITEQIKLIEELKTAKEHIGKLYSDLNNNNKLLTTVLEEMPLGLFIKDIKDNYRYLFASNFFCDNVVQKPSSDIINATDYDIFPIEAANKFRRDDLEIINSGSDEVKYIGKERVNVKGKEFVVETYKLILRLPNDGALLIGYSTDITENEKINIRLQESKERAEQSDKLKSAFLANMSHEIRTPLNAIVGFSDLLIVSEDAREREEFGKIITNNNKLLLNLINDILDISKIEAGSFTFINEIFDVNELCTEIYSIFGIQVKQDVKLIYNPSQEAVNIMFDKNRFRQILNNFLSNAVKFTSTGRIEFGYELVDGGIQIAVKDTGIGISVNDQKKVFGRFAKFDDYAQGTGLGLAICKALVELAGGKIGFKSTFEVGSTFWFWIPCRVTVDVHKRIETQGTLKREKGIQKSNNILIAEDIDSNYLLISAILKEHELTRATDGEQAVELCKNSKFDLVFMDIKMPNMNGLEATRAIREFDTATPIIALTANAFDSDKSAAIEAGCSDFASKPISKQQILEIVEQWLAIES